MSWCFMTATGTLTKRVLKARLPSYLRRRNTDLELRNMEMEEMWLKIKHVILAVRAKRGKGTLCKGIGSHPHRHTQTFQGFQILV